MNLVGRVRLRYDGKLFRIDEIVNQAGDFITWPESFETGEGAKAFIKSKGYEIDHFIRDIRKEKPE